MLAQKTTFTKAKLIGDGIQIHPSTPNDRAITMTLTDVNEKYRTYRLPENKLFRVVIRGIPEELSNAQVEEDLEDQGYRPTSVHAMPNEPTHKDAPGPRSITTNRGGTVDWWSEWSASSCPRNRQCHRCQRFVHIQSNCSAAPKCMKCTENHHSGNSKKASSTAARCANCDGAHPASSGEVPTSPRRQRLPVASRECPNQHLFSQRRPSEGLTQSRQPTKKKEKAEER